MQRAYSLRTLTFTTLARLVQVYSSATTRALTWLTGDDDDDDVDGHYILIKMISQFAWRRAHEQVGR